MIKSDSPVWRDGLAVKSIGGSSRGPGFDSQDPPDSPQPSVILVPGDPRPSSQLALQALHECGTETCMQADYPYTQNKNKG